MNSDNVVSAWTPPEGYDVTDSDQRWTDIVLALTFGMVEKVGPTQRDLLVSARVEPIMLKSIRQDNTRWCAAKRLVKRGLLTRHTFGTLHIGYTTLYAPTERGRRVWLKVDPSRAAGGNHRRKAP